MTAPNSPEPTSKQTAEARALVDSVERWRWFTDIRIIEHVARALAQRDAQIAHLTAERNLYKVDHDAAVRLATYMSENRDALEYDGCGRAPDEAIVVLREMVAERVAVCPECISEQPTCDEDRCCLTCGVDLIVVADVMSAELLLAELERLDLASRQP